VPSAPWFKFYAADYMSSPFVQGLDPEQELWYLRLIIASAISLPRGCLPLANGKLWRLAKAPSLEHFEKHAGPILAKFGKDEVGGVYRIRKMAEQQVVAPAELSGKRSEAGKLGAAKRWQHDGKADGNLPSEIMAKRLQKIADSDSEVDSKAKALPPTPLQKTEGGHEAFFPTFQLELKSELATSYVNSRNFQESSYETYFRDMVLDSIVGDVIVVDSSDRAMLAKGLEKFGSRLTATYKRLSGVAVRFRLVSRSENPSRVPPASYSLRSGGFGKESAVANR